MKHLAIVQLFLAIIIVTASQAPAADNTLHVGWAQADITPKKPVALIGQLHKRISKGVRDPLTATALALENSNEQAIMVSCDVIFTRKAIQDKLRTIIKPQIPDFDVNKLFLNATHTHTAPGFIDGAFKGLYDVSNDPGVMKASEYADFFLGQVSTAVVEAWKSRKPGAVSWALSHTVIGMNRRAHYFDGHTDMYGNTNSPDFSNIEGYEDHALEMLFFWDPDKKMTGLIINIACTSQETENLDVISADFWHDVRLEVSRRISKDIYILPQCAAAGDASPHFMYRNRAEEIMAQRRGLSRRLEIARRIANAVDDVLDIAKSDIQSQPIFVHTVATVNLPTHEPASLPFYEMDPIAPIEFHIIRLGDVAIATNPFELYIDYGVRIKARSKAVLTFLVQTSCQNCGYLPTQKAIEGGGYSADKFIAGPKAGQNLVNETIKYINEMW